MRRLMLIEASKVRHYHSTLVDGLVRGYLAAGLDSQFGAPVLYGHTSFLSNLSVEAQAAVEFRSIPVMDQDKRRLVRKSLLETWVVFRALLRMDRGDVLFVTTVLPSAMILIEVLKWFMPSKTLVILQHGELEGAKQAERQKLGSFGLYILVWLRLRRVYTSTKVAVLDRFIAEAVKRDWAEAFADNMLFVVPLPIPPQVVDVRAPGPIRACFIGFDTPNKGFADFAKLAHALPDIKFEVIGSGRRTELGSGLTSPLVGADGFMRALGDCDIAIFPYVNGYSCSLSAAATDALSAGLHLLATDRACFVALQQEFGTRNVTICEDWETMRAKLTSREWLEFAISERTNRPLRIEQTHYSLRSVGRALAEVMHGNPSGGAIKSLAGGLA